MAAALHNRGWLDTNARIRRVFKEDELVKSLITRLANAFVDKDTITEFEANKWALILTYGAYVLRGGEMPDMTHIKAVSVGELIAPVLPDTYFLNQRAANSKIQQIILHNMYNDTPMNRNRSKGHFINMNNHLEESAREEGWSEIDTDITDEQFLTHYGDLYCRFLLYEAPTYQALKPIDLFTTLYIAVAKRGNVTPEFINKITTGLSDDLQYTANLDEEIVTLVYRYYGGYITADNAREVMDIWLQDIPEIALRVRLTLQQATNSGLTALVTVGRAIRRYPDFNWAKLNVLTGGEMTNFTTAVALVDGNQYYGFNKSLGAARSTKYSSLAYVAKELLISLNGETSLKRYAGWVRAPKTAAVIRGMIETYKTDYVTRMETAEPSADDANAIAALRTLLGSARNADLFA